MIHTDVTGRAGVVGRLLEALSTRVTKRLRSAYLQAAFTSLPVKRDVRADLRIEDGVLVVRVRGAGREAKPYLGRFVAEVLGPVDFALEVRA